MKIRFLLSCLLVGFIGCGNSDDNTSELRVFHGSPDAPPVDISVNGQKILEALSYGESSGYAGVDAGKNALRVLVSGTNTAAISADVNLEAGKSYTVIAANRVAKIEPLVAEDNRSVPASGNVKVRVIHGAPSVVPVDVYVTEPNGSIDNAAPVLSNVPFKGISNYLEIPAGEYRARVTPSGTKSVAIDSGALKLEAGKVLTVIATESVGGGAPLSLKVLQDN